MLPFARMVQYGNVNPGLPVVKKTSYQNKLEMVLISDGTLYAHGGDDDYNWGGPGHINVSGGIQLSTTGVDDFWLGVGVLVRKGTSMYYSGSSYAYSGSNVIVQSLTDYTMYFTGIDVTKIKNVICGYTSFMLMMDGTLYGRGYNRSGTIGLGHKSYVSSWTLMDTGVDGIYGDDLGDTLMKVKSDGTVWGCGSNNSLQLRSPTGDVTTFINVLDSTSYDIKFCTYYNGLVMCTNDNKIHCTGTSLCGTGVHSKVFTIPFAIGDMSKVYPSSFSKQLGSRIFLFNNDTQKMMVTGYSPLTANPTNTLPMLETFSEFNFSDYNTDMYISGSGYFNTIYKGGNVWMNGYEPSMMAGLNTAMCPTPMSTSVTKQTNLPWQ